MIPVPTETGRVTLSDCIFHCAGVPDFVAQFNRLTDSNLGQSAKRAPLVRMIDEAAGYSGETDEDMTKFCAFVYEFVWLTMPAEARLEAVKEG